MFYETFVAVLFTALCGVNICLAGSSPKYTWPLFTDNPLLEIKQDVTEGKQGCSLKSGTVHSTLGYSGIYVTGSSNSYIDVTIDDSTEFKDFSFTVFAMATSAMGAGTIFHYKQDETAAIDPINIKDVILWNNQTHLIVETFGQNNDIYSYTSAEFNVEDMVHNWVGLRFSHSHHYSVKLATDTGVTLDMGIPLHTHLGRPGTLRFGASFDDSRPAFYGNMICSNMYETKDCSLSESLAECAAGDWQQNTAETNTTGSCGELKGYFEIKQKNATVDTSVSALDYMATASRIKCADLCLRTTLCLAFTLDKVLGVCKLYDGDYSSSILPSTGCNYYLRRDQCC